MDDKQKKHLETKIRLFEDMMLRSKNKYEIEKLSTCIRNMRLDLSRAMYQND